MAFVEYVRMWRKGLGIMGKIQIGKMSVRKVSAASTALTVVLGVACVVLFIYGRAQFDALKSTNEAYVTCDAAVGQLEEASDYLTDQVRLAVVTGDETYVANYFEELNTLKRRDGAVDTLGSYDGKSAAFAALKEALNRSNALSSTEIYAMRLGLEAAGSDASGWPTEVASVSLSEEDAALSADAKSHKAQQLVFDEDYQAARQEIANSVSQASAEILVDTQNKANHASDVFSDIYFKIELIMAVFIVLTLLASIAIRQLVVKPLVSYNRSIKNGEIFPVVGAAELQSLAVTYNRVYRESEEKQLLIRHQAEHDPLTDLFNRGAYDRLVAMHEEAAAPFALILVDVDTFKQVNDTYGHETGDQILKRVASLLKTTFRSIDFACRIGGDEFAVIMVEMTSDLAYTIEEKIGFINQKLLNPENDLPPVSLSVGVAFTDRENPGESLFKDADIALYRTKENGRNGITFY